MAKRIVIYRKSGQVLAMSARHNDAREERDHIERFIAGNASPGDVVLEVQTRRGEDEAMLHSTLERLLPDFHQRPDGTLEIYNLLLSPPPKDQTPMALAQARITVPYAALVGRPKVRIVGEPA